MRPRTLTAAVILAATAALGAIEIAAAAQAPAPAPAPAQGQGAPGGRGARGAGGRGGRGGGLIPPLLVKTDAFEDGGIIPERYAGRGNNVRPAFTFSNIPADTVSFAIIFHDVDVAFNGADDVLHWIVWNIPAKAAGIPEGPLPEGTVSGTANVGRGNYFGPGAPSGPRYHHYIFELYALNKMLDLPVDATRAQLLDAMKDSVVANAAYVGRFHQ
jgi:Raf kinase inhibitor-like YbhB/YbcL family protein